MNKKNNKFKKIILEKLNNNRATVDRFLGYKSREMPAIIDKKIKEEMEIIGKYLEIEMEYKIFEEDGAYFAFIIYTVGDRIDELVDYYTNNTETIRALIIDKLSIVILDSIKEYIIKEIKRSTGLYVIKEIYPGNKNFLIENQKLILESMNNIENIRINEYYQLSPLKSVALKVNLSKEIKAYYRCEDCENPCEISS